MLVCKNNKIMAKEVMSEFLYEQHNCHKLSFIYNLQVVFGVLGLIKL